MYKMWKRLAVLGAAAVAVAGTLIAATDNPATAATGARPPACTATPARTSA
ncbi:hypothetical protein GCM10009745_51390 [Kribbella yunnanensis]|uniref:Uncharacterized protein n=1 Tax=Kribbella yunnanensis TaxID=190194 RepID=A0ABP4U5N1_9ACTN